MLPPRFVLAVAALGCALAAIPSQAMAAGYLTQFGCRGNPRSVAVPNSGEPVYVGDNTSVTQYSASGQSLGVWNPGPPAPFAFPSVSPASDGVWVGSNLPFGRVQRFSVSGSQLAGWLPPVSTPSRGVSALAGAAIGGREVVVVVFSHNSLTTFDTSGRALGDLRPPPETGISLDTVVGIAFSGDALFALVRWAPAYTNARLVSLRLAWQADTLTVTGASALRLEGGYEPVAIASAPGGLWLRLTDRAGDTSIQRLSLTGALGERYTNRDVPGSLSSTPVLEPGRDHPAGIAADASGNVYAADPSQGRIVKLGPGGALPATGGGPGTPKLDNCSTPGPPPNQRREPSIGAATTPAVPGGSGSFATLRGAFARYSRVQNVLGYRAVRVSVLCPVECGVRADVRLKRRLLGRAILDTLRPNVLNRLRLRLSSRSLRLVRSARRRSRRAELGVDLTLINYEAGGSARIRTKVRVR
jgi:hypothetical protein